MLSYASYFMYKPFQSTIAIAAAVEEPRDDHASECQPDVHGVDDQRTGVLLFFIPLFYIILCFGISIEVIE